MRGLLLFAILCLAGCGPLETAVYPTTGSLKLAGGQSPAGCVVEFSSQAADTKGVNARGEVGADGNYTLKTTLNGKEKDGAVAGPHKVVVIPPPASSTPGSPPPPVPVKYMDYSTSGLTFEVKPGDANTFPITIPAK